MRIILGIKLFNIWKINIYDYQKKFFFDIKSYGISFCIIDKESSNYY